MKRRVKIPKFIDSENVRKNAEILFGNQEIVDHVESCAWDIHTKLMFKEYM